MAHQAGFKTFVRTNSRFFDSQEDFFVQILRRSADVYTKVGDGGDDDALTEPLRRALQAPAMHKLVVLHTFGSHPAPLPCGRCRAGRYLRQRSALQQCLARQVDAGA